MNLKKKLMVATLTASTMLSGVAMAQSSADKQNMETAPSYTKEEAKELMNTAGDKVEQAWDTTKEKSKEAWSATKEKSQEAWDATKDTTKDAWSAAKEKSEDAWDNTTDMSEKALIATKDGVKSVYKEVTHMVSNEKETVENVPYKVIHKSQTTEYLLGQEVFDNTGEKIATIHDIIVDSKGNIQSLVLSNNSLLSMNDEYTYMPIKNITVTKGKTHLLISKTEFSQLKKFDESSVVPKGYMSIANLDKASIYTNQGKQVAQVDGFTVNRDGTVSNVIAQFNTTFGFGGDKAIIPVDNVMLQKANNEAKIMMNESQTGEFMELKEKLKG